MTRQNGINSIDTYIRNVSELISVIETKLKNYDTETITQKLDAILNLYFWNNTENKHTNAKDGRNISDSSERNETVEELINNIFRVNLNKSFDESLQTAKPNYLETNGSLDGITNHTLTNLRSIFFLTSPRIDTRSGDSNDYTNHSSGTSAQNFENVGDDDFKINCTSLPRDSDKYLENCHQENVLNFKKTSEIVEVNNHNVGDSSDTTPKEQTVKMSRLQSTESERDDYSIEKDYFEVTETSEDVNFDG